MNTTKSNRYPINRRTAAEIQRCSESGFLKRFLAMTCLVIVVLMGGIFGSTKASANAGRDEAPVYYTYYKTITVNSGDSLWTIAEAYKTDDYLTTKEYANELYHLNHLNSDTLYAGQSLIVSYKDSIFK